MADLTETELCQALNIGTPEYVLGSSQRGMYGDTNSEATPHLGCKNKTDTHLPGAHTAWGYAVKLQETFTPPRYWYSWENRHNAKEATAEGLVKNIYKHYYGSESGPSVQKSKKKDGGPSLPRNKKSK